MTKTRLGVAASALLLLTAGCADRSIQAVPAEQPEAQRAPAVSDTKVPDPAEGAYVSESQDAAQAVECGALALGAGFSVVEHALGSRIMRVTIRNCSDEPITLAAPEIEGMDSARVSSLMTVDYYNSPPTIQPGEDAEFEMVWLSNGLCERGMQRVTVKMHGQSFRRDDCFQLGGEYAPERDTDISVQWRKPQR